MESGDPQHDSVAWLRKNIKLQICLNLPSPSSFPDPASPPKPFDSRASFTHPGLLHTASDFSRIKSYVEAQKEPWYTGWQKLVAHANPSYVPNPQPTVYRGAGDWTENYSSLYRDAAAAYALAIYWKVTGDVTYGTAAATILDAWSSTLKVVTGSSDKYLASGIYGYQLANAAEILRAFSGWSGLQAMITMLNEVFYPMNHNFLINHNDAKIDHYWANWDLCNLCTMEAIGILSDNQTMFSEAITYFKSGGGNGAIEKAIWILYEETDSGKPLGQGQEAGRDQGHAMLDFALLGVLAQQAYNQGTDLFAYLSNRILAGAEYAAKYNLGYDVPYTTYVNSDVTQTTISNNGRGNIRPTWELIYGHYGVLKGLNTSWTQKYRDLVVSQGGGAEGGGGDYGTTSGGYDQLGYGTLLYRLDA
ncbi:chondroitin AC/alginate lyase [Zopfia rhizophila CBS 207.26]|uniref:Chondroitin AC/alginate lyase n=1 Tax=Zopfia rhizophila CBS 207.26 TaxID=1314779 RepID=A0A6A6DU14_9PEZI|nr:chondroitin AC/alginate lyase [Zopfia rhizophila CBS 207.26]